MNMLNGARMQFFGYDEGEKHYFVAFFLEQPTWAVSAIICSKGLRLCQWCCHCKVVRNFMCISAHHYLSNLVSHR